jgi:uncharacterized protein (DUF983 family)
MILHLTVVNNRLYIADSLYDSMPALDTMPPLGALKALHGTMQWLGTIQCPRCDNGGLYDSMIRVPLRSVQRIDACVARVVCSRSV